MTGSVVLCTLIRRHFFYSECRTAGFSKTSVRICRPTPNDVADCSSLQRRRHELSHNAQILLVKNCSITVKMGLLATGCSSITVICNEKVTLFHTHTHTHKINIYKNTSKSEFTFRHNRSLSLLRMCRLE